MLLLKQQMNLGSAKSNATLAQQTNVFGDPLQPCSMDPLTGFFGLVAVTRTQRISANTLYVPV